MERPSTAAGSDDTPQQISLFGKEYHCGDAARPKTTVPKLQRGNSIKKTESLDILSFVELEKHFRKNNTLASLKALPGSSRSSARPKKEQKKRSGNKRFHKEKIIPFKRGLSDTVKKKLTFDPEPIEAQAQIALREKAKIVPVTKPSSPKKKAKKDEDEKEEKEDEKPRFSAISLNNSRRQFKNKVREELADSIARMSRIFSQLVFKGEEREKHLEKLCGELEDLLTVAGKASTSPIYGVYASVLERRASLMVQNEEISTKIKSVEQQHVQIRTMLRTTEDEHLEYKIKLNHKEAEVRRINGEKNELIVLKNQVIDLAKRTRAQYLRKVHAYSYEKESQDHQLEEQKMKVALLKEKGKVEENLENGIKKWDNDLNGVEIHEVPSFHVKSKTLAAKVESFLSMNIEEDSRIKTEETTRPRFGPRTSPTGLTKATRKKMSQSFLCILANGKVSQGFKSCLVESDFFKTMIAYSLIPDTVDAVLTTAPNFIEMLKQTMEYQAKLTKELESRRQVLDSTREKARAKQTEHIIDTTATVRARLERVAAALLAPVTCDWESISGGDLLRIINGAMKQAAKARATKEAARRISGIVINQALSKSLHNSLAQRLATQAIQAALLKST